MPDIGDCFSCTWNALETRIEATATATLFTWTVRHLRAKISATFALLTPLYFIVSQRVQTAKPEISHL
jgi:hypothetical protein